MITGIQITKAANDDLLNSFWLLDSEKGEARCIVAKSGFAEDEVVYTLKQQWFYQLAGIRPTEIK